MFYGINIKIMNFIYSQHLTLLKNWNQVGLNNNNTTDIERKLMKHGGVSLIDYGHQMGGQGEDQKAE